MFSSPRFAARAKKRVYHTHSESPFGEMREVFFSWMKNVFRICGFLIRLPFLLLMIIILYPVAVLKSFLVRLFYGAVCAQQEENEFKKHACMVLKRWHSPPAHAVHGKKTGVRPLHRRKKSLVTWRTKHMGGVIVAAGILALPFTFSNFLQELSFVRAQTALYAERGIQEFSQAKDGLGDFRLQDAEKSFQRAFSDFQSAEKNMVKINASLRALAQGIPGKGDALADGKALIAAGQDSALAGQHIARAADAFQPPFELFNVGFLTSFANMNRELKIAQPFLARADTRMQSIHEEHIPPQHLQQFSQMRSLLHALSGNMKDITDLCDGVIRIFAKNQLRRYLVIFQNNTELRATGGFIGSFALVDFVNGTIRNIEIPSGGSYDLQGSLRETVISPQPLHIANPKWEFQDANWFPDFPTSAKKLIWFYEKSGGPTVDGVIAINESVAEKLIQLTGPISMPEYGKIIRAENFLEETQKAVEIEYDKKNNTPKKFLSDLIPKMISQLQGQTQGDMMPLIRVMSDAVVSRDIQLYFQTSADQELFQRFGASGELRATRGDYLMIVDTNVGAGKSDGVMGESVGHTITLQRDGTLVAHIRIQRDHHGDRANPFTGLRNIDYMRIYVPYGSTVLSAAGFQEPPVSLFKNPPMEYHLDSDLKAIERDEKYDGAKKISTHTELGKTAISGWVITDVGESSTVELSYRLPFTAQDIMRDGYSLLLQRQSGSRIQAVVVDISVDPQWRVDWTYPQDMNTTNVGLHWETGEWNQDRVLGFTMQKKF
ncbi:DUF4012 domain-containing protein [Candidatus Uhrbacteria bacterium]|nr:DUF4012 domain-containing protein [Candidatus Uhrbacteria bacterium]